MFAMITKDGKDICLKDSIYVIGRKRVPHGRNGFRTSRDATNVTIYEMTVIGCHAELDFDCDRNEIQTFYADGHSWDTEGANPNSVLFSEARYYFDLIASELNSFSTLEAARSALPEFQKRGLDFIANTAMFHDAAI